MGNVKLGDKVTVTAERWQLAQLLRPGTILNDNPLYYWPLDETSGYATAADISGNAENATVGSGVTKGVAGSRQR